MYIFCSSKHFWTNQVGGLGEGGGIVKVSPQAHSRCVDRDLRLQQWTHWSMMYSIHFSFAWFIFAVFTDWKPSTKVYTCKNLDQALVQW